MQSWKFFHHFIAECFNVSYLWILLFPIFCSLQEDRSLYRMTSYLFDVLNAEQWNVFVFLEFFKLINNVQKSRMSLLQFSLHFAHILHIVVSIILSLSWLLHFLVYWFFQLLKMNDFSFFSDFRHFFGLQLISFNIRQYWEFDSKPFSKISTYDYLLQLSSGLGNNWNDFLHLNILLLLM